MATFRTVTLTGTPYIDTLYAGKAWDSTTITYSFPQALADLGDTSTYVQQGLWSASTDAAQAFGAMTPGGEAIVAGALRQYERIANIHFVEAGAGTGDIRLYWFEAPNNPTARVVAFPGQTGGAPDGDVELGSRLSDGFGDSGSYATFTLLHELGHALGLKHPHFGAPLEGGGPAAAAPEHDAIEYTVMSYRSYVGAELGSYSVFEGNYPTSPMLDDIAALQHLYGANYTTNSGDSVYTFDPAYAVLFTTVWDGGGNDTYNLLNYTTNLKIDLRPGHWSDMGGQKAHLDDHVYASGNVANAYLFDGDTRSLIENAIGGTGNDAIVGNEADNQLTGGLGNDTLTGGDGDDLFVCDVAGADCITDFAVGDAIRTAHALTGTIAAGDGVDVAAYSVEYKAADGVTTLYVDLDGATGADLTVQVNADGARLGFSGSEIVFAPPPALAMPTLDGSNGGGNGAVSTADTTPTLSGGGALPNARITLWDGTRELGTVDADDGGAWRITSAALTEGAHQLAVTQTNADGQRSAPGEALVLKVDTVKPAAQVTGIAFSSDTGASATDLVTNVAAQTVTVTLSGPLADGDIVEGSLDGVYWTDLTDKVDGTTLAWEDVTLDAGSIRIRLRDQAGNAGDTEQRAYVLDTAAPTDVRLSGGTVYAGGMSAGRLAATDPRSGDTFTYALVDSGDGRSADNAGFRIAGTELKASGNAGLSAGTKSVYVRVTDAAGNTFDKALTVTVTDAPRPEPKPATTTRTDVIDGVPVLHQTTTYADGTVMQAVTVPVLAAGGNGIDLPFAQGTRDLLVHVPAGYGVSASGPDAPQAVSSALGTLGGLLTEHGASGMLGATAGYIATMGPGAQLLVRAVTPTLAGAPSGQVTLTGPAAGASPIGLVIDGHNLPSGTELKLDNVDFAVVIGTAAVTGGAGSQHVWGDGAGQTIILGEGDDELHGGAGNDVVGSAGGNDAVYGDAGDDTVFGGAGNDTIDGGSGHDVLRLSGAGRADYTLRVVDGALVVTQRGGADGSDTVSGVETLRFAAADTSAGGTLERMYEALFGRAADALGNESWLHAHAQGQSLHQVAQALLASEEGAAVSALSARDYVAALYDSALGRTAGDAEIAYWADRLAGGQLDRAGVLLGITESAEKLAQPADVDFSDSDVATIVRLYDMAFGRAADEAGLNHWIAQGEGGMSASAIARAFAASAEAATLYGGLDDAGFIERAYETGMQREASAAELARWNGLLSSGALDRGTLLLALSESAEHVALVGAIDTSVHAI